MKILKIIVLLVGIFFGLFACSAENTIEKAENKTFKSKGVIKNVNAEKGEITIDHEEIPNLMGAMTMDFPAKDKKLLEQVKKNDQVEFELVRENDDTFLVKVTKIGEVAQSPGGKIFSVSCARCHGENGEGVEDKGISFLKGHALDHSEADFIKRVTNGKGDEMPAFKDKLSEEEIKEVVRFVREEIQSKADPKDKVPHQH